MQKFTFLFLAWLWTSLAWAQYPADGTDHYDIFEKGMTYKHEASDFEMNFRFRVQNRITYEDLDEDGTKSDTIDFAVRRMRMRFEGHVMDKRLLYRLQLAFTRGDMDWDNNNYPNILRDAAVGWRVTDHATFWFGQSKLPGNRQRVTSSSAQEFVDRSLLNATFNIDRDIGLQYWQQLGDERPLWVKLAVSNGEGRGVANKGLSIAYTSRVEWLPLGKFKDNGDYFESDLLFETSPKFSIGAVYNYNKNTSRLGGQIGPFMENDEVRSLTTVLADMLLKYQGWAWSTEYAYRDADNPVINANQSVYAGQGFSTQLSHVFSNYWAPGVRWTRLWAQDEILVVENDRTQYTLGMTRYLKKHKIKFQGDVTYEQVDNALKIQERENWIYRLQLEIGI